MVRLALEGENINQSGVSVRAQRRGACQPQSDRRRLAIDDFGTGYSSLSYLNRFRVDGEGGSGVRRRPRQDPHDTALVAAIVAMASPLELQVTAEGVETHEQLLGLKGYREA